MKILLAVVVLLANGSVSWADTSYEVRKGDTILKISDRLLKQSGETDRFVFSKKIIAANPQLKNPNLLEPGQQLQIPGGSASAQAVAVAEAPPTALPSSVKVAAAAPVPPPAPAPVEPAAPVVEPQMAVEEAQPVGEAESKADPLPDAKVETTSLEAREHRGHHGEGRKEEEEGDDDFFELRPRLEYTDYKIKSDDLDKELRLKSHINPSLNFVYGKALGNDVHLVVEAGATYSHLSSFDDPAANLNPTSQWLKNFGIGFEYEFLKQLRFELSAQFVDHVFVLPEGGEQFYLARVMIPEAEAVLNWNFLRLKGSSLGVSVEAEYAGTVHSNHTVFHGIWDPAAALYWETHHGEKRLNYRLSATYTTGGQHAETLDQDSKTYGLNLQLLFPI